jgi:hypothetical protein
MGERKLPYLIVGIREFKARRSRPYALVTDLASAGLTRVVPVGDSLLRYIFASVVGTYCGEPMH